MKKLIAFVAVIMLFQACRKGDADKHQSCQDYFYKYYQGKKDTIGMISPEYVLIGLQDGASADEVKTLISAKDYVDPTYNFQVFETR